MLGKTVLWISAILFVGYGIACFLSPPLPADSAGLAVLNGDGYAELAAMYGGLQIGMGIFCLLGALRPDLYRPVLTGVVLIIGLLALGRLYGSVTSSGDLSLYTWAALAYESVTALLAAIALKKAR